MRGLEKRPVSLKKDYCVLKRTDVCVLELLIESREKELWKRLWVESEMLSPWL